MERIDSSLHAAEDLLTALLDISKLEAGALGLRIGPITSASDYLAIRMSGPGGSAR